MIQEPQSPPPPHELRLGGKEDTARAEDGREAVCPVLEVTVLFRLLRHLGVAAPSTGERGSIAGLHCHVNVVHPGAAGRPLSLRQVLSVWQAWVTYELVVARLSRSWRWRDRYASPLYATGAEFSFEQKPWEQGAVLGGTAPLVANDVPSFVRHCHSMVRSVSFAAAADEAERLSLMFRKGRTPGKYVTLNLQHVSGAYGTLEFRQMQATTDESTVLYWAHFCAAFVEAFGAEEAEGGGGGGKETSQGTKGMLRRWSEGAARGVWWHLLDAPNAAAALKALEEAQASATMDMLEGDLNLPQGHLVTMIAERCLF